MSGRDLWIVQSAALPVRAIRLQSPGMNAVTPIHAEQAAAEHPERQYLNLLADILENGVQRGDRTGTGTLGVFGRQIRFDLSKGFPVLTTKKLHLRSIIVELLWFLKGDTNIAYLKDNGVRSGTSGPTRTATWAPSMASSGARGPRPTVKRSTRSPTWSKA
jgi:hypothetical protein